MTCLLLMPAFHPWPFVLLLYLLVFHSYFTRFLLLFYRFFTLYSLSPRPPIPSYLQLLPGAFIYTALVKPTVPTVVVDRHLLEDTNTLPIPLGGAGREGGEGKEGGEVREGAQGAVVEAGRGGAGGAGGGQIEADPEELARLSERAAERAAEGSRRALAGEMLVYNAASAGSGMRGEVLLRGEGVSFEVRWCDRWW